LINFVDATKDANHYTKPPPCCTTNQPIGSDAQLTALVVGCDQSSAVA